MSVMLTSLLIGEVLAIKNEKDAVIKKLQLDTISPCFIEDIEEIVIITAIRHNIDANKFLSVAKCESSLRPKVIGDDGSSIGLFQIHLPSHPEVAKEEALDPYWSAEWSAKKFKINPHIWVCYNKLYGL